MNLLFRTFVLWLIPGFLLSQNHSDSVATLIFTGDLTFAHNFEQAASRHPIDVFAKWDRIGRYDAMIVNLENAVTRSADSVDKEFVFKMRPELLPQLVRAGVSIVNCANNHSADFGTEGILETINFLDSAGIKHIGIGKNLAQARKPAILIKNGIKIGFLGYGGVKDFIAARNIPGTSSRSEWLILDDIRRLRPLVDFVVVNLHWGTELAEEPDSGQISLAHKIIDSGADLIVGHHPHVLQGIEKYDGKIIIYSLGNFIFGGNINSMNSESAVVRARFTKKGIGLQAVPIRIRNWQPAPADSLTTSLILMKLQERSKIFLQTISFLYKGAEYE
jgi:poly-gamma-glutamate capsule biosynthesis protein CapA/YwtB (metallophosphatase superfamily)